MVSCCRRCGWPPSSIKHQIGIEVGVVGKVKGRKWLIVMRLSTVSIKSVVAKTYAWPVIVLLSTLGLHFVNSRFRAGMFSSTAQSTVVLQAGKAVRTVADTCILK